MYYKIPESQAAVLDMDIFCAIFEHMILCDISYTYFMKRVLLGVLLGGLVPLSMHAQEKKPQPIKNLMKPKDQGSPLLTKEPDNAFLKKMGNDKTYTFDREKTPGKSLDMQPDEKFLDPADDYLRKLKNPKEREKNAPNFKEDQYLGDLRSEGKFVQIVLRDHEHPDGDLIQVLVNDVVVHPTILLESQFKVVKLDLDPGFNKIDFLALNQGESGPNTAEVRVFEDDGTLVAAKRWNLATGVKATYIVVKE